jgi:hypothetical protein
VNELLGHDQSIIANEGAAGGSNALLAIGCEGDVGGSCMASVERPFGLAVADDEAPRSRHAVARYGREPGKRKKKKKRKKMENLRGSGIQARGCRVGKLHVYMHGRMYHPRPAGGGLSMDGMTNTCIHVIVSSTVSDSTFPILPKPFPLYAPTWRQSF